MIVIIFALTILIFLIQIYQIFLINSLILKKEDFPSLVKPSANMLKAWTKKEKKKPRVNDDSFAWRKENNLE